MLKIENHEVVGWEHAIRGMRNPKNSWEKSDSCWDYEAYPKHIDLEDSIGVQYDGDGGFRVGPDDQKLMMTLRNAGTDHRKFMRMITVYLDITAPLYWWKEFDTYKVGTVANSCSTMHKIHEKEFCEDDFSHEYMNPLARTTLRSVIKCLNTYRLLYNNWDEIPANTKSAHLIYEKKEAWWQMIQLLPTSYNQKRTVMLNYEVLANIYKSRRHHKLYEWHTLCDWIESLPYSELITGKE